MILFVVLFILFTHNKCRNRLYFKRNFITSKERIQRQVRFANEKSAGAEAIGARYCIYE